MTVRVAVLTVSDTRTESNDEGGDLLARELAAVGCDVVARDRVPDDPTRVRDTIMRLLDGADAVITTGGTGIAPRDQTYEAVEALMEKRLDGFGEAFRRLSWAEVGPKAILSRAVCGTVGRKIVAALPGSPKALTLAVRDILGPILPHAVKLARGETHAHT